ncbi:unnamed protein product, partial [Rotaria magnacalcarata]
SSQYFKSALYEKKTYHEVVDEIYYRVKHLEPWEKGSRKTSGLTGMCGGQGYIWIWVKKFYFYDISKAHSTLTLFLLS